MATQNEEQFIGIDAIKRMPDHSSSDSEAIRAQCTALADRAESLLQRINLLNNLNILITDKSLRECHEDLAGLRQISAALDDIYDHFANSLSAGTIEFPKNRANEYLKQGERKFAALSKYFER